MSFLASLRKNNQCVYYLQYTYETKQCWYIFQARKERQVLFEKRFDKNDPIALSEYGDVLYSGWAKEPTAIEKDYFTETYGINFNK